MRRLISALTLSAGLLLPMLSTADGYQTISPALNTANPDKVEVLEFFWLGCPHCYALEPDLERWLETKPEYAEFVREAPPLNPSWEQHSRGYYAAQIMGIENEFVVAMFDAIHQGKKAMRKPSDIAALAATLGVDEDKFLKTMTSFAVQTKLARSLQLAKAAGITGVPSILINGKFLTSASLAGSQKALIDVIDATVAAEHAASGS